MSRFDRKQCKQLKEILEKKKQKLNNKSNSRSEHNRTINTIGRKKSASRQLRSIQLGCRARTRLLESRFRSINEYLYSHSSRDANEYLTRDLFNNYHSIYEKICEKWPKKPIDYVIEILKKQIKANSNRVVIADIGCGNRPQIRNAFYNATPTNATPTVHSFDLVSSDVNIIAADMTSLPLPNACCDYAVFSLALMPTNLRECLFESNRVLKTNSRLIIVEVLSRFDGNEDEFARQMTSFGFELRHKNYLNQFFVYFEFEKQKRVKTLTSLPVIQLKTCVYKRR